MCAHTCVHAHTNPFSYKKVTGDHFVSVSPLVANYPLFLISLASVALYLMNYASPEEVSKRIKLQPPNSVAGQEPALFQPAFPHEVYHSWNKTTCRWFSGQQITQYCLVQPSATRRESPTPAAGGWKGAGNVWQSEALPSTELSVKRRHIEILPALSLSGLHNNFPFICWVRHVLSPCTLTAQCMAQWYFWSAGLCCPLNQRFVRLIIKAGGKLRTISHPETWFIRRLGWRFSKWQIHSKSHRVPWSQTGCQVTSELPPTLTTATRIHMTGFCEPSIFQVHVVSASFHTPLKCCSWRGRTFSSYFQPLYHSTLPQHFTQQLFSATVPWVVQVHKCSAG